jgi:two-component system chemotaxis response regulator CheB
VVVIGVSTGGPSALERLLPSLPENFAVPILIVQHMPRIFTGALAERLNRLCRVPVYQAKDGDVIHPGAIWLAPGDAHMEIAGSAGGRRAVKLHHAVPLNSCKPSVDYLFRSAALSYRSATLALVMTGMGADGLDGARAVRDAGGVVLAQDEASSAVWGMPGRVVQAGLASETLGLASLAGALIERVRRGSDTEVTYGVL